MNIVPTYRRDELKIFNIPKLELVLKDLHIEDIETCIFTRDILCNIKDKTLYNSVASINYRFTFSNILNTLTYILNYYGYTIVKFKKYFKNVGLKNCHRIIPFHKLPDNFKFSSIKYNLKYDIQLKKIPIIKFNTKRDVFIYMDFK